MNRLPTSLIIDDIGVRLDPAGFKTLSAQTYASSKRIQEFEQKKWVNVSIRHAPQVKLPVPVWPFSASPVTPSIPPPPPSTAEASVLQGLVAELKGIIGSLKAPQTISAPVTSRTAAAPSEIVYAVQPSDEPMFIPKQILPNTADVNINVAKSETEREGFDDGLAALKKARKR